MMGTCYSNHIRVVTLPATLSSVQTKVGTDSRVRPDLTSAVGRVRPEITLTDHFSM
jgi:hypothetical protein